ncbi:hypothetical protein [uncultured Nostoc sp.]|uniref:hypothetical protein n=1 Tax=uncultured Nostoc sp. TaxID=340711 RepID=UPI0035CBAE6D
MCRCDSPLETLRDRQLFKNELRKNLSDAYGWLRLRVACVVTENCYKRYFLYEMLRVAR